MQWKSVKLTLFVHCLPQTNTVYFDEFQTSLSQQRSLILDSQQPLRAQRITFSSSSNVNSITIREYVLSMFYLSFLVLFFSISEIISARLSILYIMRSAATTGILELRRVGIWRDGTELEVGVRLAIARTNLA